MEATGFIPNDWRELQHPQSPPLTPVVGDEARCLHTPILSVGKLNRLCAAISNGRSGPPRWLGFQGIHMGYDREKHTPGFASAILLLFLVGPPTRGDESDVTASPESYVCHRLSAPIAIDGKLDDLAWRDIPWTADFVDIEGVVRPRPRFRTRA